MNRTKGRAVPAAAEPRQMGVVCCCQCEAPSGVVTLVERAGAYYCKGGCDKQTGMAVARDLRRRMALLRQELANLESERKIA